MIDAHMAKKKEAAQQAKVERKESKTVEKEAPVKTQPKKQEKVTGAQVKATVVKSKKAATK